MYIYVCIYIHREGYPIKIIMASQWYIDGIRVLQQHNFTMKVALMKNTFCYYAISVGNTNREEQCR